MKAFITALIIFAIIFLLVSANAVFTSFYSKKMIEMTDAFPKGSINGAEDILNEFREYYSSREFLIMATNNHTKVYEIYRIISQMQAAIITSDMTLYTQSRLALYDAIRVLAEFNKFSLIEIF